jgi:hypothetical protein
MKKLADIPDKNPFKVPDNYFEDVNRKIISAAMSTEKEAKTVSLYSRFRTTLLIAASVAAFILISYSLVKILAPDKKISQVSEVLNEISPDSIINDIDISSLEENAASLEMSGESSGVSKKDIIDYLMLDNIEVTDIYAQL